MSKRRLTRKQAWRLKKIQQERIERATRKVQHLNQTVDESQLGPEVRGRLIAHHGLNLLVESSQGRLFRCFMRQNIAPLVTGDYVIWRQLSEEEGVVVAQLPRKNSLTKPDDRQQSRPMAANVDQIVIVVAIAPWPSDTTLDRYLIAATYLGIPPVIVINKWDLTDIEDPKNPFAQKFLPYQHLPYPKIEVSCKTQKGVDRLLHQVAAKTNVFVGQSGVGKSSLISKCIPKADIKIGEISALKQLGKHTTSTTRLYHLPQGGSLIDSPGIRQFKLGHLPKASIIKGFVEFQPYIGQCKFRDCQHHHEPRCALLEAVKLGKIHPQRLENFKRVLAEFEAPL